MNKIQPIIKSGVYLIINRFNSKVYVGSSINVKRRLSKHKSNLIRGKHENNHLQRAWNKYGENRFSFIKILDLPTSQLAIEEKRIMKKLSADNYNCGYNIISTPYTKPPVAVETKLKLSEKFSGENSTSVILNWEIVNEIRSKYCSDFRLSWKILAEEYGVSISCIQGILNNSRWKDVNYKYCPHPPKNDLFVYKISGENSITAKLKWDDVYAIRKAHISGIRSCDLARQYNVSQGTIFDIVKNKTWRHK